MTLQEFLDTKTDEMEDVHYALSPHVSSTYVGLWHSGRKMRKVFHSYSGMLHYMERAIHRHLDWVYGTNL